MANRATARVLEDLGATTLNLPVDLSLAQIAAIRQAVDCPLDVYVEGTDDYGSPVRYYEIPELVRLAGPGASEVRAAQLTGPLPVRWPPQRGRAFYRP